MSQGTPPPTLIHRRVEEARSGRNPKVICRMRSGWAVLGDVQPVEGYSLLLPDPVVPSLNDLSPEARRVFLDDMTLIGDALLEVTKAKRINYEVLGNGEPALHAHVFPRYDNEPEALQRKVVWFYDWQHARPFDPSRDRPLMQAVASAIERHNGPAPLPAVNRPPEVIETERLRLRIPTLDDAEAIFEEYAQDPEVTKFMSWRPHRSIEETRAFLTRCLAHWHADKAYPWVITRKDDGRLMGAIEAHMELYAVTLGYVLARAYWGNGYTVEAARAVIRWAFQQPSIFRVQALCDAENRRSWRVMEKAGMQREGLLRQFMPSPNLGEVPRDHYGYAITRHDFDAAREE